MLERNNELFHRRRLCTFPPVDPGTGGCLHCGEGGGGAGGGEGGGPAGRLPRFPFQWD